MDAGLTLWGYYVPANILLTWIAVYVVISITLIILIPILAVPIDRKVNSDGKLIPVPPDDLSKIVDMRSKIRSTIMQTLGGLAVFGTVITSIQGIRGTEDTFNQKKRSCLQQTSSRYLRRWYGAGPRRGDPRIVVRRAKRPILPSGRVRYPIFLREGGIGQAVYRHGLP